MESVYASLSARALDIHKRARKDGPYNRSIIVLAGPPGSGKSTIATEVIKRVNADPTFSSYSPKPLAVRLPMDGFHLSRKQLDALPNREEAHERRGIAWTFDAEAVVELIQRLHKTRRDRDVVLTAPDFDHHIKDPVPGAISIPAEAEVIIVEGNWLLYDEKPWSEIGAFADDTWFVDVDQGLAVNRIAKRHLKSEIENTWADAEKRARGNDLKNGQEVRTKLIKPNIVVQSVEEDITIAGRA